MPARVKPGMAAHHLERSLKNQNRKMAAPMARMPAQKRVAAPFRYAGLVEQHQDAAQDQGRANQDTVIKTFHHRSPYS